VPGAESPPPTEAAADAPTEVAAPAAEAPAPEPPKPPAPPSGAPAAPDKEGDEYAPPKMSSGDPLAG
jgi:hypothetical protein